MLDKLTKLLPTPSFGNTKKKLKKYGIITCVIFAGYVTYSVADKYFNKATAEENLKVHITKLYSKTPDSVSCANVDTSNYDSRVTCEARIGEKVHVYLCKGFLDGFDNSCIAPKINIK